VETPATQDADHTEEVEKPASGSGLGEETGADSTDEVEKPASGSG
jgi:hypothetical protein